jgi:hypothetical protein
MAETMWVGARIGDGKVVLWAFRPMTGHSPNVFTKERSGPIGFVDTSDH